MHELAYFLTEAARQVQEFVAMFDTIENFWVDCRVYQDKIEEPQSPDAWIRCLSNVSPFIIVRQLDWIAAPTTLEPATFC